MVLVISYSVLLIKVVNKLKIEHIKYTWICSLEVALQCLYEVFLHYSDSVLNPCYLPRRGKLELDGGSTVLVVATTVR